MLRLHKTKFHASAVSDYNANIHAHSDVDDQGCHADEFSTTSILASHSALRGALALAWEDRVIEKEAAKERKVWCHVSRFGICFRAPQETQLEIQAAVTGVTSFGKYGLMFLTRS